MTHKHAAAHAQKGAELISRLLKSGRIPDAERSEACDIAIDLNRLAQHHAEAGGFSSSKQPSISAGPAATS